MECIINISRLFMSKVFTKITHILLCVHELCSGFAGFNALSIEAETKWLPFFSELFSHGSNIPILIQIMAWHRPGNKPLLEPIMVSLLRHICVNRPQWVKSGQLSHVDQCFVVHIHDVIVTWKVYGKFKLHCLYSQYWLLLHMLYNICP